MPSFKYQSMNSGGASSNGVIAAPDRASAIRILQSRGETALSIDVLKGAAEDEAGEIQILPGEGAEARPNPLAGLFGSRATKRPTLGRSDTSALVRELATALEAGLPLMQALRTVRQQASGRALPEILDFLIEKVEAGQPLHQACREYGPPFDDMICGMLRAADASGRMSEVLHQLADLLERSVELRREVLGATLYPMIVTVLICCSIVLFVSVLLPRLMEPIQSQPNLEMPLPTTILLGAADLVRGYWFYGVIIAILLWLSWRSWIRLPGNRLKVDTLLLKTPLIGRLLRDVAVARFTRTLGTLVAAGLPILNALKIVRDTLGNQALMDAIDGVQEKVTTGQSLAAPLERCGFFPPLLVQIVNIGERSGRLENMLLHAADAFDRQVNATLKIVSKLLPPVLLIILAVPVVFVIMAILLPLLELQSAIGA